MAAKKAQSKTGKTRNWAFIVYPESAPENWREILEEFHLQVLISPLHCDDVSPDGEPKKPHYHVILKFDGPVTQERADQIAMCVLGTRCEKVSSLRQYARYLCHLDNPEKAQYETKDVIALGGLDYLEIIMSAADMDSIITDMEQWCDDQGVFSYAQLCRYARKEKPEWARALRHKCTIHMKAYLQSCQWELDHGVTYVEIVSEEK